MRPFFARLYWRLPLKLLFLLIRYRSKTKISRPIQITQKNGLILYTEFSNNSRSLEFSNHIWFHHPQRISRYFMGINERLEKLLAEYCINQIPDLNPGIVIDIGSNIGEFSLALSRQIHNNFFIRFEPSITENMASLLNTSGIDGILIPRALWSEEKVLEFFEANETGDSSLFPPKADAKSIHIQASSLDIQLRAFNLTKIELIKLEAEGAEPEILLGATKTLRITKYIVADLGPERGIEQKSTYDAAIEILAKNNFELIGRNQLGRQCFLFRNSNFD